MIRQSSQSDFLALGIVRDELVQMKSALPVYASWRFTELQRMSRRYRDLLHWLIEFKVLRGRCSDWRDSLQLIEANVQAAVESGDWRPFNKAVIALEWDIEELIRLIPPSM